MKSWAWSTYRSVLPQTIGTEDTGSGITSLPKAWWPRSINRTLYLAFPDGTSRCLGLRPTSSSNPTRYQCGGRPIKAVAQLTKQGFIFVFDRITGEPVWPSRSGRPCVKRAGERLSPTQPFPTRPAPFERQGISVDDLIDFTPELRAGNSSILQRSDHGLSTRPSERGT
ncbi:MAG: hypothetical protein CM1200mP14_19510 [Gammaproteobacteria bacterium]|nr:MAG: hypothetical protein CM1200mP14_19510 [Gammaproteobacteria bacterium]